LIDDGSSRPAADADRQSALLADAQRLIDRLRTPAPWPHPVQEPIGLVETHISWVLLTGRYAYKLPKPLNLGFLDFTSLEQRLGDCREELRLNRRLCSDLYLDLAVVLAPADSPRVLPAPAGGLAASEVLAWAVRMRQFPQESLLPAALDRGDVQTGQIDGLAHSLARFHAEAAVAPAGSVFGSPAAVLDPVRANFQALQSRIPATLAPRLDRIRQWTESRFPLLIPLIHRRQQEGRVRECHGDLHLGNMLLEHGRIVVFDCLAFSPDLRWIDVISDMAFLVMDLQERRQPELASRLLNRWLEHSGDYGGLELWRWYVSYRALVRAKVAALSGDRDERGPLAAYLAVAERQLAPASPRLLLCHGLSGSGKSHLAMRLAAALPAIRLCSDVERKRWFGRWGIPLQTRRHGDPYADAVSEELYLQHLPALATRLLASGFNVIVDATFLQRRQRQAMAAVAERLALPWHLLDLRTPLPLMCDRIQRRVQTGVDPSDADLIVLERQRQQLQPLDATERERALSITPHTDLAEILAAIHAGP